MKNTALKTLAATIAIAILIPVSLFAAERGTATEAQALLKKAVEHYQSVGRKQALEDFTGKKAPWVDRDLYVVCLAKDHTTLANGSFPSYVGASVDPVKDENGKPLGQAAWDSVAATGTGSVKYRWINPVSGKSEPKIMFNQKVAEDVLCGVGVYP